MNIQRYWMAVVASFISMAIAGVIGSILVTEQLASYIAIGRGEEEASAMMPIMMAAYFVITAIFCYIYIKIRETGDLIEGIKIGIMFGVMMSGMTWISYTMLPFEMPALLADNAINIFAYIVGGVTVALIYKPAP